MQRAPARPKMRSTWLALAIAMSLQACGGGSGGGSSGDTNTVPTTNTVSGYGATRPTQSAGSSNGASPSANLGSGTSSSYADTTLQLAIEELNLALDKDDNVLAAPPLTLAHLNALISASYGTTASQLRVAFPDAEAWTAQLKNDNSVSRQLWSPRGQSFLLTFLRATDLSSTHASANAWQGHETGFFNSPAVPDASLDAALQTIDPEWSSYSLEASTFNRLTIVDALQTQVAWSNATTFDGRFQVDGGSNRLMTMLKVSEGVRRYTEADFTTNALTSNGLTIMSIVPSSSSVRDFAKTSQLNVAIKKSLAALSSSIPAGELILPAGTLTLAQHADSVVVYRNATLPYDEVKADMGGLDGNGGTYAKVVSPASVLTLTVNALSLQSANATEFIFSPLNQHGPQYAGGGGSGGLISRGIVVPSTPGSCSRAPDLRSFFLVILDTQQAVLSITAIIDPQKMATGSCQG